MINAVLFDLDGTLVDTETISANAWRHAGDAEGFEVDDELILSFVGRTADSVISMLAERYGITSGRAEEFFRMHQRVKGELMDSELKAKPFAKKSLSALKERGYQLGLATSSYRPVAERELAPFDLLPYFDTITCGDEVTNGKPDPEIYLLAGRRLGMEPAECAVVEDSPNGVRAGHAAGMPVFLIPDTITPAPEIRELCTEVLGSLDELTGAIELYNDGHGRC